MYKRMVVNRIILITICFVAYFIVDYVVQKANFLEYKSYIGIKNFIPITFALLFGGYGIIGECIAATCTFIIFDNPINNLVMEYICIIIPGLLIWFLWHIKTEEHRVHFKHIKDFAKYILIVSGSYLIVGGLSYYIVPGGDFISIFLWYDILSISIGIPICIMYSGLMYLNPILPPLTQNGKKIVIKDDIVFNLNKSIDSFAELNEKIENFAIENKIEMKRLYNIQSCIEEFYLRIIHNMPDAYIDFRANYDIIFSVEFNYIGKKYNPLYIKVNEEPEDVAGLKLIKHRALIASYSYLYGENNIHVVM